MRMQEKILALNTSNSREKMGYNLSDHYPENIVSIESIGPSQSTNYVQIGCRIYSGIICQAIKDACAPIGKKELLISATYGPSETHMTPGLSAVFFIFENTRPQGGNSQFEKIMGEIDRDPALSRKLLINYGDSSVSIGKSRRNQSAINLRKRLRFLRDQIRSVKAEVSNRSLSIGTSNNENAFDRTNSALSAGQFVVLFSKVSQSNIRHNGSYEVPSGR